ncbi:hypothetical protein MKW98_000530 [Papaver atlanticum]|uniref:Uncharacterized protein n=1 Tax=Papaver atlanticum TaxID=357466 RepID=A0AAD4X7W1_9MAGN|nr:hypothetical protein MKW98_000530 [Papaver atlanticum]
MELLFKEGDIYAWSGSEGDIVKFLLSKVWSDVQLSFAPFLLFLGFSLLLKRNRIQMKVTDAIFAFPKKKYTHLAFLNFIHYSSVEGKVPLQSHS